MARATSSLPEPLSPVIMTGASRVRDAADHFEDLLHRRGFADDRVLMLLDGELRLEGGGRAHLGLRLERGIDDDLEIEGQRFFPDEIERARASSTR